LVDVYLEYYDEAHSKINCDAGILMELYEHFEYFVPNYKFNPKYKARIWNGKISLVNRMTRLIYCGLNKRVKKFCEARGYTFAFDDRLTYDEVSESEVREHLKTLNLPDFLNERDYQVDSIVKCLRSRRRTLLSPTSSGKSFIIYAISQWYKDSKTLIIVPSNGLVAQFESDIRSYGFTGKIHTSLDGILKDNDIDCDICVTTWQSLDRGKKGRLPKKWFEQFGVVFGDECHGCKADTLVRILSACNHTPCRIGTTGTLDDQPLHEATIEGLFGPPYKSITTREMIDQGYATPVKIICVVLKYTDEDKKEFHTKVKDPKTGIKRKRNYQDEIKYVTTHEGRNRFITNLAQSLKGNKLVFFKQLDHGETLKKMLDNLEDVFYIEGSVKAQERESIRAAIEEKNNAILLASLGTTSTGVSIKKLHHLISAAPQKSKIKVVQAIGRMLRQHKDKKCVYVFDIVDDLTKGSQENYCIKHFRERVKIYDKEQFPYKIKYVRLK